MHTSHPPHAATSTAISYKRGSRCWRALYAFFPQCFYFIISLILDLFTTTLRPPLHTRIALRMREWCSDWASWRIVEKTCIIFLNMKRLIAALLFVAATLGQSAQLLLNSSHTHDNFQLTISLAPHTLLRIHSEKIAISQQEWLTIDARTSPATIIPPLQQASVLVNAEHQGRSFVHLYHKTSIELHHRHFHYLAAEHNDHHFGLLLPQFSQMVPAFRTDRMFRCSNSIVSVDWIEDSAHIVIFSQHDRWRITENIDGGFRSDERGVYYGYAIDYGHVHPVRISIGDHQYCLISQESTPALIEEFDWQEKEDYNLDDLLFLAQSGSVALLSERGRAQEL